MSKSYTPPVKNTKTLTCALCGHRSSVTSTYQITTFQGNTKNRCFSCLSSEDKEIVRESKKAETVRLLEFGNRPCPCGRIKTAYTNRDGQTVYSCSGCSKPWALCSCRPV